MKTSVGIDPGSNGGLVVLKGSAVMAYKMPDNRTDIAVLIASKCSAGTISVEWVPKWCGKARYAEKPIPGSSIAVLYGNFMFCLGVIHGLGFVPRLQLLPPLKWQNAVQCRNLERADTTEWKNKLKARAQELYPGFKPTLWSADALLIAHAGRILAPRK